MKKVSIVIVAYNMERYIADCLGSLARIERGGLEVETIVVDNASKDATAARIRAEYPWVRLVENAANDGFAGGNNIGMRLALEGGADYVYLLNHDTEVTPRFLVEAVAAAESDPAIGAVQSLLLLSPEKGRINSTGNAIHFLGLGYSLDYRRPVECLGSNACREITYPSGAGVLLRARALAEVGLFDDSLFMYHEDLDLAWRLRLAGYRIVMSPASVVYHKYEFSRSIAKYYYMERNRFIVLCKNLRLRSLLVLAPLLLGAEVALFFSALRGGWWREKLKAYRYFFDAKNLLRLRDDRARVQAQRKVGDREIVKHFTATIAFQDVTGWFTERVANPLMTAVWAVVKPLIA